MLPTKKTKLEDITITN